MACEAIDGALEATPPDDELAYAAALRKARSLPHDDYARFRAGLEGHLLRRGFGYGTVRAVVNRLWDESGGEREAIGEEPT